MAYSHYTKKPYNESNWHYLSRFSAYVMPIGVDKFNRSWQSVLPEPGENMLEYIVGGFFTMSRMQYLIFLVLFISAIIGYVWLMNILSTNS